MAGAHLTRQDVVAEAAALADREGAVELTVSAVARSLGVSQPALYRHVSNFEDLQRRVAILVRGELRERLLEATAGRTTDEALRALAVAWRDYVLEHTGRYAVTDRVPLDGDEEAELAVQRVVDVIAQIVGSFGLDHESSLTVAWAIRSSLHGFSVLEASGGHPATMDHEKAFDQLVELLLQGVRAEG